MDSFAVLWQSHSGTAHSGRLEIGQDELQFRNKATDTIRYDDLLRIDNDLRDRIGPRRAVRLTRRDGRAMLVSSLTGMAGDLTDIISSLQIALGRARGVPAGRNERLGRHV